VTLSIAYWCVLIAALLPYLWGYVSKSSGERYDNRDPRGWTARQSNPRVHRAHAAELNSYEAFAPFAAGVILAQLAGVPADRIAWLAIAFVILRVLHGIVYIAGLLHTVRSVVWTGSFTCVVALLVQAALRIA
jgi:uncharacterized MAPEG superfamily protein